MSTDLTLNETITLRVSRCLDCGRYYGYEPFAGYSRCPTCGEKSRQKLAADITERERTISALRGALTKALKRKRTR
jgi:anaerobic ribonucleoside-triphosphate reductase